MENNVKTVCWSGCCENSADPEDSNFCYFCGKPVLKVSEKDNVQRELE